MPSTDHALVVECNRLRETIAAQSAEIERLKADLAQTTEAWALAADARDQYGGEKDRLREALEKIANLITAPRGRTVAMKEIARAALKETT